MNTLPEFFNYVNSNTNNNYGLNSLCFESTDGTLFYFSYKTLIAFKTKGHLFIRENDWGPTTGKHLNTIESDKTIRFPAAAFEKAYDILINKNIKCEHCNEITPKPIARQVDRKTKVSTLSLECLSCFDTITIKINEDGSIYSISHTG